MSVEELQTAVSSMSAQELVRLPHEMLRELRELLTHTDITRGLFFANHASNYIPLRVKMPADKQKAIQSLDSALRGQTALKPEWMRGL